jgi:single-stranded-DNA-specific exonuclease
MNPPRTIAIKRRDTSPDAEHLVAAGLTPLLARIYAARGVHQIAEVQSSLAGLPPPELLLHAERAAIRLADAIERQQRILIVADYDADGATACATGVRGLRAYGAVVDFLVPNRFEYGYGLTPEIVALAAQRQPQLLITVDNGIASVEGVAEANRRGIEVLVTDHHLPGNELPAAFCIVNPNQTGCSFPSKHIAGVGVMFYVLLALRAELRRRQRPDNNGFKLASLLDLVALGTVADVVRLDATNRILVGQGLARMRSGVMHAGLRALFAAAGRDPARATTYDLGFLIGPRLNAAGRLADMALGIRCLITDDSVEAQRYAVELDRLNRERREIESGMTDEAQALLDQAPAADAHAITLFQPDWHPGIIGILASRLKDRWHRPAIAFARSTELGRTGEIKGSGRSINGFHLRDALDLVSKREPGMLSKFGGHAMAAGLTLRETELDRFILAFEGVAREWLTDAHLQRVLETDGSLDPGELSMGLAESFRSGVWGQGFPAPAFDDTFVVEDQRWVGGKHLRLRLAREPSGGRSRYDAIAFNQSTLLPARVHAVYRLDVNEYRGTQSLQLMIDHWEPS